MAKRKIGEVPRKKREEVEEIKFGRLNYLLILLGLLSIVLGYLSLSKSSITLAPMLLVLGYCILIPLGLVVRSRQEGKFI